MYRGGFLARPSLAVAARQTTRRLLIVRGESRTVPMEHSCVLTVVAEAGCDDFQQPFTCMGNKQNPPVAVAIKTSFFCERP